LVAKVWSRRFSQTLGWLSVAAPHFKRLALAGGRAQFVGMKKWLLRISLGFLAVIGLLLACIFLRSLTPAPVQNQELQLARATISPGANGYDLLAAATNNIWWPKDQEQAIGDLVKDTNWDDALAATVLASNREALAGWDAAVKLPDFQVPEVSTMEDLLPYLASWKQLAQLAMVRENFLLHRGQDQAAFDELVKHIQLGRRMENSHGVLIVYLVGAAVNTMGLGQIQHWVGKTQLTPDQLKAYSLQLKTQPGEAGEAFANAIRVEHQVQMNTLAAMRAGRIKSEDLPHFGFWSVWPIFSYSQTEGLFARGALMLVKAAPHHYSEANVAGMQARPDMVSICLSGNPVGQILFYMMMPALAGSLEKKSKGDVQLQAIRTILALRAYQLTHGHLPPDLNALVPEFLEAVPVDDFDGQPLRYSAEKKIVYSVGKNLKDDGGDDQASPHDSSQRHLDLAFKFEF